MSFRDQSLFTPVATPQSPAFPESFANIEELYQEIDRYFATSFESKVWISEGDDVHCHSVAALETTRDVISSFKNSLITACNLVAHGDEGVLYMVKGSSKIKDIVKAGSPKMIPDLLELAFWLISRDRFEIVRIILQQFADMSAVYRDQSCHIYRILAQYSTSPPAVFEKIAFNAWRRIVDAFQRVLGKLHVTSLKCRLGYLTQFANSPFCDTVLCLFSCDHARTSEKLLRDLLRKADDRCRGGPNSVQSEMVLQALVNIFLARPAYAELEATGQDIMRRAETETTGHHMLFMALKSMSEAQMSQLKFAAAEPHLRRLVDLSAQTYGWDNSRTIRHMIKLETCFSGQEKVADAHTVRMHRLEVTRKLDVASLILD